MSADVDVALAFGEAPDGRMVSIADVPSGKACGMVCPGCRAPLSAKKGAVIAHHFAHEANGVCSVAYETMVHKLAKQIISDEGRVHLPKLEVEVAGLRREVYPASWLAFDRVELEVWQGGIRPDIVGYKGDRPLAVEVLVTHACSQEKIALVQARQAAMIEVDLSAVPRDASLAALSAAVLRDAPRRWLFNAKLAPAQNDLLREIAERQAAADAERKRVAEEQAAERVRREAARERALEVGRKLQAEALAKRNREGREADELFERTMLENAARTREANEVKVAEIKAELLLNATKVAGAEQAALFMETNTDFGWSPSRMSHPNEARRGWDAYHRWADAHAAAARQDAVAQNKLLREATTHFRQQERAFLWLRSKHPKLGMRTPREVCVEPDGVRRCMALLK